MKLTKKLIAIIAAGTVAVAGGTVGLILGLNNKSGGNGGNGGNGGLTGDEMMCTVAVKSEGGMRMSGATVVATDKDGNVVKEAKVGANGKATFYLDDGEYNVKVKEKDLPLGYYQTSFGHKISNDTPDASITLGIELVEESDRKAGFKYQVGDVMHDFTIPTLDGETLTLSEILEEKDMVFLNFWYTTCNPCLTEMPWMNNAYNNDLYVGQFEMIAVHNRNMATVDETKGFLSSKDWNFKFSHSELTNLESYFTVGGYPTTVIIDRYGVVTLCETGRLENQTECNNLIAKHLGSGYKQNFAYGGVTPDGGGGDIVYQEVTEVFPGSDKINNVLGTSGLTYTPDSNKYVWPFIVKEVDGRECLMASNGPTLGVDAHNTSSVLNVKVNVPELADYTDYTFTFDYKISSEYEADYLYVLVDGVIVQKYSGPDMVPDEFGNLYVPSEWKTSYAYVPVRSGEHTLSFVYYKDGDTSDGEDTVYIDNLRFAPIGEGQSYVYRDAATDRNNDNDGFKLADAPKDEAPRFNKYANVYLNQEDGLYHVHNENGPLLLANTYGSSSNWSKYPLWDYLAVGNYLQYKDGGEIVDLKPVVEEFAVAELQSLNGFIPVNQELKEFLKFITIQFGSGYENEWLEFCSYYDAYNCEQMENPCAGVTFRFAIEISNEGMDEIGAETRATVNLRVALNPRGYRYAFTPTVSGVYRINSDTSISADPGSLLPWVWLTEKDYKTNEYGDIILLHESIGFDFRYRLEAGMTYYIAAADFDPQKLGDKYEIVITFLGNETAYELNACASYYIVADFNSGEIEAKGIRWGIDDEGYVRQLRNDNSFGAYIYVDMVNGTNFMWLTLEDVIKGKISIAEDKTAFDFTGLKIDTDGDGVRDTEVLDENGNSYGNCIEKMKGYLAQATASNAELKGYAKVTEELRMMLELFTQQVHGEYIRNAWQTMCYYYREV